MDSRQASFNILDSEPSSRRQSLVPAPSVHRGSLVSIVNSVADENASSTLESLLGVAGVGEYILQFITLSISTSLRITSKWFNRFVCASCSRVHFRSSPPSEIVLRVLEQLRTGIQDHLSTSPALLPLSSSGEERVIRSNLRSVRLTDVHYAIPEELGEHKALESITFSDVSRFPEWLPFSLGDNLQQLRFVGVYGESVRISLMNQFVKLKVLDLSGIQLADTPIAESLSNSLGEGLAKLEKLILRDCGLRSLLEGISNLSQLRELDVSHNFIRQLPSWFGTRLPLLECLNMRSNPLTELPATFNELVNMKELQLVVHRFSAQEPIGTIPAYFSKFPRLTKLNVSSCKVERVPLQLLALPELRELNLGGNTGLRSFPRISEGHLPSLEKLSFKSCGLSSIPEGLVHAKKLKKFTMKRCRIFTLPETFGDDLQNVERMNLMDCELSELPESFARLSKIRHLHLSGNHLGSLPDWFGSSFPNMEDLFLGTCNLRGFPGAIRLFPKLRTLNLFQNQLGEIPHWISELSNLQEVQLSRCDLEQLPNEIAKLPQLRVLLLEGNFIQEFPQDFNQYHLSKLRKLNLSDNLLREIPETVANMNIRKIELGKNPLRQPPVSHCRNITTIRTWYKFRKMNNT